MKSAVKFGPASVIGYATSAFAFAGGVIEWLSVNHVDTTSWKAFGLSTLLIISTNLGRQHQAKAVIEKGGAA